MSDTEKALRCVGWTLLAVGSEILQVFLFPHDRHPSIGDVAMVLALVALFRTYR